MEAEIKAGAKLDMLTKSELQEVMDGLDFNVKIGRGLKFRRVELQVPIVNGNAVNCVVGPEPGFTWGILYASAYWYHTTDATLDAITVFYHNNVNPISKLFHVTSGHQLPDSNQMYNKTTFVLHGGDELVAQIWDTTLPVADASPTLSIALGVVEVPTFSEGLLNL